MVHGVNNPLHKKNGKREKIKKKKKGKGKWKEKRKNKKADSIDIEIQTRMDHEEASLKPIILPQSIPCFLTRDLKVKEYNLRSLVFSNDHGEPTASL